MFTKRDRVHISAMKADFFFFKSHCEYHFYWFEFFCSLIISPASYRSLLWEIGSTNEPFYWPLRYLTTSDVTRLPCQARRTTTRKRRDQSGTTRKTHFKNRRGKKNPNSLTPPKRRNQYPSAHFILDAMSRILTSLEGTTSSSSRDSSRAMGASAADWNSHDSLAAGRPSSLTSESDFCTLPPGTGTWNNQVGRNLLLGS